MKIAPGDWSHSLDHDEPCRIIGIDSLWGERTAQVWLARRDAVVRLPLNRLRPLADAAPPTLDQLCYVSAAARILDALERDVLIAPLEGSCRISSMPCNAPCRAIASAICSPTRWALARPSRRV